ncbi:MAG: GMC family oxidoreductase [Halieaceae bacterium]|jgi:choline dehydrogenase-like flavoprotein|nr:GMC family oxidoreductase [Halieaceae bacterium]
MIEAKQPDFDAIVIGSGMSGGWAAKELCERGLKVLVLERGKDIQHGMDYLGEHAGDWKLPYQGKKPRAEYEEEYAIQQACYAMGEGTRHVFNNDKENPYHYDAKHPFEWLRADAVGGRSLLWGRQVYRWSDVDFQANSRDGYGIPWPIGYEDVASWYTHVEKHIGVSGEALGLPELPDSEFLPPMELFALEKTIKGRLAKKASDVKYTIGRVAVLTQEHKGRAACHYCGPCHKGCSTGSYFSSQSSTLPAARATGNLTLLPNSVVERLEFDPVTGHISEVHVINSRNMERKHFSARLFFLCASTVGSTQIMLNSRSETFPDGLANSSGTLGTHLMDHVYGVGRAGIYLDNMNSYYHGNRPTGGYIPRFRNLPWNKEHNDYLRGFNYQTQCMRTDWRLTMNSKGFGADLKNSLRKPGYWVWATAGFGECLPRASNRMYLHHSKVDRFGIPQVGFEFNWHQNEHALVKAMNSEADRLHKAAGAIFTLSLGDEAAPPGRAIHEMGTARMGDDPTNSVLNSRNQAHDVANLFVTDGSCMTSASCVNPSLTYMALTARAVDYAVTLLTEGQL